MDTFDPTRPPEGRLARLGVVVDAGQPPDRVPQLALLCDRAGIDVVWLGGADGFPGPGSKASAHSEMRGDVGFSLGRARLGFHVTDTRSARFSLGRDVSVMGYAASADILSAMATVPQPFPHRLRPRRSALLWQMADLQSLLPWIDDVCLPGWAYDDLEAAADEVRADCQEAGRDPSTVGVAVLVPVSIGRTEAEADARARMVPESDGLKIGHPSKTGIFGTLEDCQDRVIALAHAGVTDIRCIIPGTPDVHDVIAQLTAMTVGSTDVLRPGSLRSPSPPPPEGWGGRPDRPMSKRVSGDSRPR